MLKTEGRNRSLSFTYTGTSTHMGSKILRQPDAEHLIQSFPIKEFKEENEDIDDFALPRLPSPTNPKEAERIRILERITSKFHLTDAHLRHIEKRMLDEVNRGLGKATNRSANVKSFVTYVHEIPSGRESGQYLALDLGGTNFRVILVELEAGSRSVKMKACKHEVRISHSSMGSLWQRERMFHDFKALKEPVCAPNSIAEEREYHLDIAKCS